MALRFTHSAAVIAASHSSAKHNINANVSFKSNQILKIPSSQRPPLSSSTLLLTSSVGSSSPPPSPLLLQRNRHLLVLNSAACIAAISASWVFISAIPTLLAFKTAAHSLEKLLDVTREDLPDTMAAVRLSGMEISDLAMELSDLGQGITEGVRSTTHAVCLAEDRLRRLTMSPPDSVQVQTIPINKAEGPALARKARILREGIVKGRAALGILSSLSRYTRLAWNLFAVLLRSRRKP